MEKLLHTLREAVLPEQIQVEIIRKAIHLLVALVPVLAAVDVKLAMFLLASGTLFYLFSEKRRLEGRSVMVVSTLTVLASRDHDRGHFVLGPITLGIGAMMALLLYPEPAASIAIYALAFGDSLACLAGRLVGGVRIPLTGGKTLAGSTACFLIVLWTTYRITHNIGASVFIGASAALFEALPTRDLDNLLLPVGTGLVATRILMLF